MALPFFQFSDGAFTGVTAVKSLDLDNNKLKSLPKGFEFGTITNLTLSNNPWSCTCQLAPLRRYDTHLKQHHIPMLATLQSCIKC